MSAVKCREMSGLPRRVLIGSVNAYNDLRNVGINQFVDGVVHFYNNIE